jgi:ribonuclease D
VAVDTEFHSERRNVPELYLVQVHVPGQPTALIDAAAVRDLRPLGQALGDCEVLLHGGERDLQLLALRAGLTPTRVVDTQVLAGCAGLGFPRRLEDLYAEVLDMPESHERRGLSDWSRRPLSPDQLAYAAADVAALHALAAALEDRVGPARARAAAGATAESVARWLAPDDPLMAWRRVPAARVLSHAERLRLRHLMAWRFEQARTRNLGPWNIASDRVMVDLARRAPGSRTALAANRLMPKGLVKRHGDDLVALLAETPQVPLRPLASAPRGRAVQALIQAWALGHEARTGVAAALLMPAWRLDLLVADWLEHGEGKNLSNWVEEFSGEELRSVMTGQTTLRVDPEHGLTRDT